MMQQTKVVMTRPRPTKLTIVHAFLGAMLLLTALPLAQAVIPFVRVEQLDEHRTPTSAPDPRLFVEKGAAAFADALNRWVDDRIGFRDLLIRLKNLVDYTAFGVSRKVYVGSNEWLFERSTTESRLALERLSEDRYAELERSFVDLKRYLERRDIHLIVVVHPDKSIMYPQYMPSNAPTIPANGKFERLKAFLAGDPSITVVDVEKVLRSQAGDQPLYYKTDIHPNLAGAIPVVREIVRQVAAFEGREDLRWNEQFRFQYADWTSGSEGRFLGLLKPVRENILYSNDAFAVGKDTADGHWVTDTRKVDTPAGQFPIFDFGYVSQSCPPEAKFGGMALFGNSFSDLYWVVGLQNYFCWTRRARTPAVRLAPFLDDLPADTKYLIFEFLGAYVTGESPDLRADQRQ